MASQLLMRAAMLRTLSFLRTSTTHLLIGASLVIAPAAISPTPASAGPVESPVVGGTTVKPGAWPDVVAVLTAGGGLCSGTLLGADLVLTAAHCTDDQPVEVIVGAVDLSEPGGQIRKVSWSKSYPHWTEQYDVGVVMLEHPVFAKQRAIASGCSTRDQLVRGTMLDIVGFGLTTAAGTGDNTSLHQAKMPVTDPDCTRDPACAAAIAPGGEFVAGGHGTDACFGDSGGPVYITTALGPALIGVVSRGLASSPQPCGDGGIYVRADKVVDWIESTTGRKVDRVPCDTPADDGGDGLSDVLDGGGCSAGGEAVGGTLILVVLAAVWLLALRRGRTR